MDADHKIISVGACLNPACNSGYEGNPINLHSLLVQCLSRTLHLAILAQAFVLSCKDGGGP